MNKMVKKLKGVRAKLRNNKGFTLIEMLVVVAIIGILVLLALPRYVGYTKDANVATVQADIRVLEGAALMANIDNEEWPVGDSVLEGDYPSVLDTTVELKKLDETDLKDHFQSLKNDVEDYGIITTKGDNEGKVVFLKGEFDRKGDKHYGLGDDLVLTVAEAEAAAGE